MNTSKSLFQDTEQNITYSVELSSVDGGGRVGDTGTVAYLTVLQNDDSISFAVADTFKLGNEGESVIFDVIRGGQAKG